MQFWKLEYKGKIESYQQAGIGLAAAIDGEVDYLNPERTAPRDNYRGPSFKNEKAKIDKNILNRYDFDYNNNHILLAGSKDNPIRIQVNSSIKVHSKSLVQIIFILGFMNVI